MVLLETFALSSAYAGFSQFRLYKDCEDLMNGKTLRSQSGSKDTLVETTDIEKYVGLVTSEVEFHPPTYINTGSISLGVGIPVGGGFSTEERFVFKTALSKESKEAQEFTVTNFGTPFSSGKDVTAKKVVKYMNDLPAFKQYLEENKIDTCQFPIHLPMKVIEVTPDITRPTYLSNSYNIAGTNKRDVARMIAINRNWQTYKYGRLALGATVLTGALIAIDWRAQKSRIINGLNYLADSIQPKKA